MQKTSLQNIADILHAEEGTQVNCAVKVVQQSKHVGKVVYVKDATCLTMKVCIPEDVVASSEELFPPETCLLITGTVSNHRGNLDLSFAEPLEDEAQLNALASVSIKRRRYDFDPAEYQLCNTPVFLLEYEHNHIHANDIFGQTVARLFGRRVASDKFFASLLNHALSYIDWVHHEKKLLREFWELGTNELLGALTGRSMFNRALGAEAGVAREIEDAFRHEGWEYYNAPGYGFDAPAEEMLSALPLTIFDPKENDSAPMAHDAPCNSGAPEIIVSDKPFSGVSTVSVFQDFEKTVIEAFSECIAKDSDYAIHVWHALSGTTWQDRHGRQILYRPEAANLLVSYLAGPENFQPTAEDCCWCGIVLHEIAMAMKQLGWRWLKDIAPWVGNGVHHFENDLKKLFGKRMPRDKQLCEDIWATITSAAWYNANGESVGHFGGRGAGDFMAELRCKGYSLDWYWSEGRGARQNIIDALKSCGWYMWPKIENLPKGGL